MSFNKMNKITRIIITVLLALCLLTGCKPAAEKTEEPAAVSTAEETPAVEKQAAEEPAAEEPVDEKPAAEEAVVEEPAAEEPAAEEPTVEEAVVEEPAAEEAAAEEPTVEEAVVEEPAAEEAQADAVVEEIKEEPALEAGIVAEVDGDPVYAEEFSPLALFIRYQYLSQYQQYAQVYASYGVPLDSLNEQMEGILGENSRETMGSEVIDQLVYNKILEKEAESTGFELPEQDVIDQMKQWLGYEEETTEEESVAGMSSYNVDLNSLKDADDLNADFKEYAETMLAYGYQNDDINYDFLTGYARSVLLDNALFAKEMENRLFTDEMVNARHILVEDEETAKEVQEKLANGEAWEDLASQYSIDTSNKDDAGNLGWFARGQMVSEFEEAAFALEPGETSEPVQTSYGYHLINSLGKEVRPLEGNALQSAQNEAYTEWTTALRAAHEIKDFPEVWTGLVPMEPAFTPIVTETEEPVIEEVPAEEAAAGEDAVVEEESPVEEEAAVEEEAPAEEEAAVVEEAPAEEEAPVVEEAPAEEEAAVIEEAPAEEEAVKDDVIAEVDGQGIGIDAFKQWAVFARYQYLSSYTQYAQLYAMYGLELDELNAQIESILGEEGKEAFAGTITDTLVFDEVLKQEAEAAGIEISDSELLEESKLMLSYITGSDEESEETAEDAAEFKTYAENKLNEVYQGAIDYDFLTEQARASIFAQKLFDRAMEERTFEAEMVNARHILVEDEETAKDLKAKLDAGEDWDALCSENSLDTSNKDNGGALGWFGRGEMVSEFEDAAFALEAGEISDPIKSDYGYHIIASDGKEVRPLEGYALENAKNALYEEWVEELLAKHEVKTYPKTDLLPTEPAFEPLQLEDLMPEAEVEEAIVEEAEVEEAEVEEAEVEEAEVEELVIDNTEEDDEYVIDNTEEDDEYVIDNTEQDDSIYTIDNDAEVDKDDKGKEIDKDAKGKEKKSHSPEKRK